MSRNSKFHKVDRFNRTVSSVQKHGVQRGDKRGNGPWHPRQGGIQRVELQKLKCCNYLIMLLILKLLTHAAWI